MFSVLGKETTINQIEVSFGATETICDLKFEGVFAGSQIVNLAFLIDREKQIDKIKCPYKLDGKSGDVLAHGFYPGSMQICGDLPFDIENWKVKKTTNGCGEYNLLHVGLHEICDCLGFFHQNEPNSIMQPCYRHGYSVVNRFEAVSVNDKKLLQEMYGKPASDGKPKTAEVRSVFTVTHKKAKLCLE